MLLLCHSLEKQAWYVLELSPVLMRLLCHSLERQIRVW